MYLDVKSFLRVCVTSSENAGFLDDPFIWRPLVTFYLILLLNLSLPVLTSIVGIRTTLQLLICTLITIQIGRMAWLSWAISEHTMGIVEIPIWPAKSAVFMGFLLLSLRLVIQFLEMLIDKKEQPDVPGLGGN